MLSLYTNFLVQLSTVLHLWSLPHPADSYHMLTATVSVFLQISIKMISSSGISPNEESKSCTGTPFLYFINKQQVLLNFSASSQKSQRPPVVTNFKSLILLLYICFKYLLISIQLSITRSIEKDIGEEGKEQKWQTEKLVSQINWVFLPLTLIRIKRDCEHWFWTFKVLSILIIFYHALIRCFWKWSKIIVFFLWSATYLYIPRISGLYTKYFVLRRIR